MSKPVFAIVGGTGAQGESTLHAVAASGQFKFRILTKDTNSAKVKALTEKYGADIEFVNGVQGNAADADKLFHGATWAFIVTNFLDPAVGHKEKEVGITLVDSAKKNGVKHLIFSTLPHAVKISGGKYSVPHFDHKAEIEQHIRSSGIDAAFVAPSFYYQNWTTFFSPRPNGDGTYSITLPSAQTSTLTAFDVSETGNVVAHFVKHWNNFKGKLVTLAGDQIHPQDYVKAISEATGLKVNLVTVPYEVFEGFVGKELADMFHFYEEYGFGTADWGLGKKLVGLTDFKTWADKNKDLLKPKSQ